MPAVLINNHYPPRRAAQPGVAGYNGDTRFPQVVAAMLLNQCFLTSPSAALLQAIKPQER